jgi:hypothetical protein
MARISDQQVLQLREAIHSHDFLHRIARQIEHLHKVVFHERTKNLDAKFIRASAEEILIADIATRHKGNIDGVYFALRHAEDHGRAWKHAIADYAAYVHNYYTTPLGVVMRRDLFGDNAHFVTPAAGRYASPQVQTATAMKTAAAPADESTSRMGDSRCSTPGKPGG